MTFDGAVVRQQGVTFGILVVKAHVLTNHSSRDQLVAQASRAFGGVPTVLMAQQAGRSRYYGRPDLVKFLARVPVSMIPWKRYRLESAA